MIYTPIELAVAACRREAQARRAAREEHMDCDTLRLALRLASAEKAIAIFMRSLPPSIAPTFDEDILDATAPNICGTIRAPYAGVTWRVYQTGLTVVVTDNNGDWRQEIYLKEVTQ